MNHELNPSARDDDAMLSAIELSPAGRARRSAMLADLLGAMQTLHRRRRAQRRIVTAASCACILVAAVLLAAPLLNSRSVAPENDLRVENIPGPAPLPAPELVNSVPHPPLIVRITTDPAILDRYRADPPRIVQRVGDEELLRTLAAIDRPAGLIRIGEEVRLTSPVTDDELR